MTEQELKSETQRLALQAASEREDCDITPRVVSVSLEPLTDGTLVCEVDVAYSSRGHCALYGLRARDLRFELFAD
jgi:hypothetical protein